MYKYIFIPLLLLVFWGALHCQTKTIQDSYNSEALGEYPAALQVMQSLAAAEPNEPFYQIRIAWLLYLSGKYTEALGAYQKSVQLLDCVDAQIGVINCQLALANWDSAIKTATDLLKIEPRNSTILGKLAYAAYMKKDYKLSSGYYGKIVELYPWDMENRAYYVNNLYLAGKITEAKAEYAKLKKYHPSSRTVSDYSEILNK